MVPSLAATEAREFWDIYKMNVVEIPTNVPVQRILRTLKEEAAAIAPAGQKALPGAR